MEDRFKFKVKFEQDGKIEIFDVSALHKLENGLMIDFKRQSGATCNIGSGVKGVELIQCTGLKDKDNNLVYEGDILKAPKHLAWVVKFDNGCYWAAIGNQKQHLRDVLTYESKQMEIESPVVIGNIYENPELLGSNTPKH